MAGIDDRDSTGEYLIETLPKIKCDFGLEIIMGDVGGDDSDASSPHFNSGLKVW